MALLLSKIFFFAASLKDSIIMIMFSKDLIDLSFSLMSSSNWLVSRSMTINRSSLLQSSWLFDIMLCNK